MPQKFREEWIVKIGKETFLLNEKEILILKEAMKRNERWISFPKFIFSVPHIECIYLNRREIANQLPEGEKVMPSISREKWEQFKKQAIKKLKNE